MIDSSDSTDSMDSVDPVDIGDSDISGIPHNSGNSKENENPIKLWEGRHQFLSDKLAQFSGPIYQKAYLSNLLASGSKLFEKGSEASAEYCFNKVAKAINEFDALNLTPAETAESSELESPSKSQSKLKRDIFAPFEAVKLKWRADRIQSFEKVFEKQASRLSPLEKTLYRDKIDKLNSKTPKGKIDASLQNLRAQLYRRILKSQKVSLKKKNASGIATPNQAQHGLQDLNGSQHQGIIGPYNERYNYAEMLTFLSQADSAWVEEFLELYQGLQNFSGFGRN